MKSRIELQKHYSDLYKSSKEIIESGLYETDKMIDDPNDRRFGITLLLRPPEEVRNNISNFLMEMKNIDPNQYYYPQSDMHITVLSIISCHNGFDLSQIDIQEYSSILRDTISPFSCFNIKFEGVTASPSCFMIQGFPEDDALNRLRKDLKRVFSTSTLHTSIDKRYKLKAAHSTVIRFKTDLENVEEYLEKAEQYKSWDFGTFEVSSLELVFTDWYQSEKNSKRLMSFKLKKKEIKCTP